MPTAVTDGHIAPLLLTALGLYSSDTV